MALGHTVRKNGPCFHAAPFNIRALIYCGLVLTLTVSAVRSHTVPVCKSSTTICKIHSTLISLFSFKNSQISFTGCASLSLSSGWWKTSAGLQIHQLWPNGNAFVPGQENSQNQACHDFYASVPPLKRGIMGNRSRVMSSGQVGGRGSEVTVWCSDQNQMSVQLTDAA